jgi:hypothetical protein
MNVPLECLPTQGKPHTCDAMAVKLAGMMSLSDDNVLSSLHYKRGFKDKRMLIGAVKTVALLPRS